MTSADSWRDEGSDLEDDEPCSVEDRLEKFRADWKHELGTSSKSNETEEDGTLERAKELFMKGVHLEQLGSICEALAYYRQAVRLVPDIEFKIDELKCDSEKTSQRTRTESSSSVDSSCGNELFECEDLVAHFSKMRVSQKAICEREYDQTGTHIAALPAELLQHVLRWVVSSSLDLRSLEMFSLVCHGFYLLARDVTLWKMACSQVWRWNNLRLSSKYLSWRDMYINKQRLHFDGVYISRASYFRTFENEFGHVNQNSWHFFVYYRYARFFPDGKAVMLTSPEEPADIVSKLKDKRVQMEGMQYGHYTIKGDEVQVVVKYKKRLNTEHNQKKYKRNQPKLDVYDPGENTFHSRFNLKSNVQKGASRLVWTNYYMVTKYRNAAPSVTQFDIGDSQHPALHFSRVLSYNAVSEEILDFPRILSN